MREFPRTLVAVALAALAALTVTPDSDAPGGASLAPHVIAEARADEAGPGAPAPKSAKTRYSVAAMGDSLTDPKSHGGKYLELLQKRCPQSRFDSYGKGGNMVNQMRKRFVRDIFGEPGAPPSDKPKYTHVIVLGGINDIISDETANRTNEKIKSDLGTMYKAARTAGAKVIAVTMPPWGGMKAYNPHRGEMTLHLNQWIREQVTAGAVDAVFDSYALMSCGQSTHLCEPYGWADRVHWSVKGHEVAGEAMFKALFADCE